MQSMEEPLLAARPSSSCLMESQNRSAMSQYQDIEAARAQSCRSLYFYSCIKECLVYGSNEAARCLTDELDYFSGFVNADSFPELLSWPYCNSMYERLISSPEHGMDGEPVTRDSGGVNDRSSREKAPNPNEETSVTRDTGGVNDRSSREEAPNPNEEPSETASSAGGRVTVADDNIAKAQRLRRASTAPALIIGAESSYLPSAKIDFNLEAPPSLGSTASIVSQAFVGLLVYLAIGMAIYTLRGQEFSGPTTNWFFDALYFCVVTMCTIGYGDITPITPVAKLFSCAFVLVGFGIIDVLLSAMISYVLQKQETLLLNSVAAGPHETARNYLVDVKKRRMRVRLKVILAFGVVIICIVVGAFMMAYLEGLGLLDAFYLSCMSVTTVGYGDHAFKSLSGRVFASVWLLLSTLAVTQSFLFLAEARIDKRHRLIAKWVLEKEMTLADLVAADLDKDGSVSKSDFVLYKLKQMGKIDENDIEEITRQFSKLDPKCSGKITLPCFINLHKASTSRNHT
ncbi:hypothetical protein KP509_19G011000 [Ceratopteris richardii]|uniref:Potassium channel domain-containing protein n=1 Tax=Ceratopteris richardii TaxID=49495 RepID=A0A8T2SL21_CERRI|nr:hypothetical protein KP509_19G011000 [Ceratopteris richardii]KAH7351705.1 hypothetical protein KP509_19G011000 [Ceratopteris richardii]